MPYDNSNPVAQGLMQGVNLGQMILQAGIQRRQFEQQQEQTQRNRAIQDLEMRLRMMDVARPLEAGGTITDTINAKLAQPDPSRPGELQYVDTPTSLTRKADASRTVKLPDGTQYELLTPEQQQRRSLDRDVRRMQIESQAKAEAEIRFAKAIGPAKLEQLAAEAKVRGDAETAAHLAQMRDKISLGQDPATLQRNEEQFRAADGEKERKSREEISKWHERVADIRAGQENARAIAAENRMEARQTRMDDRAARREDERMRQATRGEALKVQAQIDKNEAEKAKLHQQRSALGQLATALGRDKPANWKKTLEGVQAKLTGATERIKEIEDSQRGLESRKRELYGRISGGGATGGSAGDPLGILGQ